MALTPAIAVSQSALTPNSVTITDISEGTDVLVTQRRITITDAFGTVLTGDGTVDYTEWPIDDISITFSFLTEDIGADIFVEWLDVSNNVLYDYDNTYPLSEIGKSFFYYLIQSQGLTPGVYMDTNYVMNLAAYYTNLVAGDHAVTFGNDIAGAQNAYNRVTQMRLNQTKFF